MSDPRYRRLLRSLLLPINLKYEDVCATKLADILTGEVGTEFDEQSSWLESQVANWEDCETPSQKLAALIVELLIVGNSDYQAVISENYFLAHKELIENQLVGFELARSFLSHLLLVARLADEELMSSAQISIILHAMNPSAGFGRRSIEAILGKMRMAPSISADNISSVFESDKQFLIDAFGDAELDECISKVSTIGQSLGFKGKLETHLATLANEHEISKYTPYIQILHYQCSILEFFDHFVKDFYEFSPRGAAAKHLFSLYPSSMVNASNPFLNNAKSVAQVDFPWAAAKKNKEFPGAAALFTILDGLDEMGYAASKELAQWLRSFIHRFMIAAEPLITPLPETLDVNDYELILDRVSVKNTATKGIIEQRVVDALATVLHKKSGGWVARGIGDSVNASNLSKKKLGDCDFQNLNLNEVVAYEAHGGLLTQTYLNEHINTLPKSAKPRISEWAGFSEPSNWTVKIVFVAHDFNASLPQNLEISGTQFCFEFLSYQELIGKVNIANALEPLNRLVLEPLSKDKTPSFVRTAFINLME